MRDDSVDCSEQHENLLNSKKDVSFAYLYEIFLLSGEVLSLSSSNCEIITDDKIFLPFSGVNLEKGEFNDSAENIIILSGIFDKRAVCKKMDLAGCKIKIYLYIDSILTPLVTYFITEFEKNDLDFQLKCEPETTKYNQSLLLLFSTTCRANFGDAKCGVNIDQYKKTYEIKHIKSCVITLSDMNCNSGYYNLGQALFLDKLERIVSFKIISHNGKSITLDKKVSEDLLEQEEVILVVSCDKKFITCCNKFNNAVNFRGEPTIDQHNFLKNNA
ncbi:MAG: phage BR0599 family protein [Rickettsiaceae bacterium]